MQTIAASEARGNFAEILERVHYGKSRIAIERRGKPFAALVPIEDLELIEDPRAEALRQSEARLRAIMDHAPVEIYLKDAEGRYVEVNRHYEELWGVSNEEIAGKLPGEAHRDGEIAEAWREQDLAVLESGEPIERDDERHPGGLHRTLHTTRFPIRDEAGEIAGMGAIAIDITERRKAEDALRESYALYQETERLAKLGFWQWDEREDRSTFCSNGLAHLHGVSVEEYIRRTASTAADLQWVHPDDRERVERISADAKDKGTGFQCEYRLTRADGEVVDVLEVSMPIGDENGALVRSIGFVQDITERKRAEDELKESEKKFHDFADATSDWFWEMDEDCRFSYFSERFTEITGVPQDALLGKTREETGIPDLDPEEWKKHLSDLTGHRSFRNFQHPRTLADGRVVHLSINGKAVFGETGEFRSYRGTGSDITEQVRAEAALRESEERFRGVFDFGLVGMAVLAPDGRFQEINKAYRDLLGYDADDLIGEHFELVIHPDDLSGVRRRLEQLLSGEVAGYHHERRYRHKKGHDIWGLASLSPLLNRDGTPRGFIVQVLDITERKKAEEALRESEARLRAILDHAPMEIYLKDTEGRYLEINRRYEDLWGVRNEYVHGKLPGDVHEEEAFAKASRAHDLAVLKSGNVVEQEDEAHLEDGPHILHMTKFPIRDAAGRIAGLGAIAVDVTERKRAEEALRGARDELELRVEERTAELQAANAALTREIGERKQAKAEAERSRALLASAVEALDEGFVIFDDESRLVLCNSSYREIYGPIAETWVPGVSLARVARDTARHAIGLETEEDVEVWVRERLARHRQSRGPFEQLLGDGRWIRVADNPLPNGWTVGTRTDLTDLKRIEAQLRNTQARLIDAIESIPDAFILFDADERMVLCNSKYRDFFSAIADVLVPGAALEDLLRTAAERGQMAGSTEDPATWVRERLDRYRAAEGTSEELTGDGRWMLITERRTREGGIVGVRTDITERKRSEDALAGSEERLRQATQLAGLGYYIWDSVSDRCLYCSEEFAYIHGTTVDDYMARASAIDGLWSFTHREDRDAYIAGIEKVRRGEGIELEYRVMTPDGETRHVAEIIRPVFDAVGRVVREYGTIQDISGHKRAEAALRESEARYRELFEDSPLAMMEEDWRPVKRLLNGLAERGVEDFPAFFQENLDELGKAYEAADRFGVTRAVVELYRARSEEELQAAMTPETAEPEELHGYGDMISAFFAGAAKFEYEADEIACDGSEITTRVKAVIPPKYRDDWSRVLVTMEDITEQKAMERQLRQAQKMEAVGQLTGGIAHDFNNLLAVIMGNAEFLGDELGASDRSVESILRAASRGAELTQRLLAFSRRQPLRPRAIDLGGLVAGMTDLIGRTLGATIEVETEFAEGAWTALADPGQVENALLNLAINARDSMPEGGRLLIEIANAALDDDYASAHMEVRPGDYVMLAVSDNGSGMEPEVLEHAFEPFFTTKDVGEGSGLGLSMVYGFAKQSGGDVRIYSEAGHGTTVKLYLPRADAGGDSRDSHSAMRTPSGHGETVLVVEDDPDVRALAERLLANLGYRVLTAADARAGMRALEEAPHVDLLLSDVVLPGGMSGLDFAAEAVRRNPAIKRLFMSGYTGAAANRRRPLPAGTDLLDKPFRMHELALKMRAALDG